MLRLASIFQTGMVLQREKTVYIWGLAEQGAQVNVSVQNQNVTVTADENGNWTAVLNPLTASESEILRVTSDNEEIIVSDVAVGEVWLAGGQSNMEFHMRYEKNLSKVRDNCANSRIRFYDVPEVAFDGQMECFDYSPVGIWRKATPEDIEYFSAVGYYFEREIEKYLDLPVAIIGVNWGGSVSASWMNPETVRKCGPEWMDEYDRFAESVDWEDYWQRNRVGIQNDRGDVFHDAFSEFFMPVIRTPEEAEEFFRNMADAGTLPTFKEGELQPIHIPGALYTHMVCETAPYTVRGALWYQGESDDERGRAHLYQSMLTGLISDWREAWKDKDLPFLIVQLPGYDTWMGACSDRYDLIRDAQEQVTKTVPDTYLCSASDMGEQFDIHPKNKLPIGERLALLARGHVYGESILCDAPAPTESAKDGNVIAVTFSNADQGLILKGETVNALEVTADGKNIPFRAVTENNKLIITLEEDIFGEIRIDFAKTNYYIVNLYNKAGMPAVPFSISLK